MTTDKFAAIERCLGMLHCAYGDTVNEPLAHSELSAAREREAKYRELALAALRVLNCQVDWRDHAECREELWKAYAAACTKMGGSE
jgi:hypothetical protein